jgi:hypothetical protein
MISPAIPTLQAIGKHLQSMVAGASRGSKHTTPSKDLDIRELVKSYSTSGVHVVKKGRVHRHQADKPSDVVGKGAESLLLGKTLRRWWAKRAGNIQRSKEQIFDPEPPVGGESRMEGFNDQQSDGDLAEGLVEEGVDYDQHGEVDSDTNRPYHAAERTAVVMQEPDRVVGNEYWEILQEEERLGHWEDVDIDM